jgi:transposase
MPEKRYVVQLTDEERSFLTQLIAKKGVAARRRTRAQILLKADVGPQGPGWTDQRTAEAFDVTSGTVENVRRRLVEEGLDMAVNRKPQCRPSRQRLLDGEKEAKLVAMCCSKVPPGHTRWTLKMLANELVRLEIVEGISSETVRKVLKKTT